MLVQRFLNRVRPDRVGHLCHHHRKYLNRTYLRSNTLWEGRFRSCLTQSESYLLACYRHIELNPVWAGMVIKPQD